MTSLAKAVFVVGSKRTAYGAFNGKLKDFTPVDLQVIAAKAALVAANVKPELVEHVIVGNAYAATTMDTHYIGRHTALRCGMPQHVPAYNVNRLCGSGFQAIVSGAYEILVSGANVVLAGGSENMTMVPHVVHVRGGAKLGAKIQLQDMMWDALVDLLIKTPMGVTAENIAEKFKITREEADDIALKSQIKWAEANKSGTFKEEIVPITLKEKGQDIVFDTDENPRMTSLDKLAKLKPAFKKDGTVTAGNASGIGDGAAAVVLASEDAVKKHNLKPLARLVGWDVVGCDPHIMGMGPVEAIRWLLNKTGKKLDDISLFEINEAFAVQYLAVERELGLDQNKCNVNGGAVAIGHPIGSSGSRLSGHLIYELRRRGQRYGIGSACIGGGQGIALMFENTM